MKDLACALALILAGWASTAQAQLSPPVEYYINQPVYSADFNDDDLVNSADLAIWTAAVGVNANGDADGDSDTDGADYLLWQQQVGASVGWVPIQRLRGDYNTQLHELTYILPNGWRRFLRYTGVTATPQGIWLVDDNDMGSRHQLNHSVPPDRIIVVAAGPVVNGFRPFYYQYFKNGSMYLQTPTVSLPHGPWTMLQQQQQGGQQQQQQQGQGGQQQVQEYWTN